MTIEETVAWFNSICDLNSSASETRQDFYCGLTNNLDRRKTEHSVKTFIATTHCDTPETARELERQMNQAGYDTGNQLGNGTDDSIYVYVYKKIPGVTKE